MFCGGDARVTLLASQWPGPIWALPPRNGLPPKKNGTLYDAEHLLGFTAGSGTPARTGPLTNALIVGSAPNALNAASLGVCATVCLRRPPLAGVSRLAVGFSTLR